MKRAVRWILALQSSNGGWASFDRDNTNSLLTKLPFCDFGEVLDPPTVDVTAHVVEALAHLGWTVQDRPIARALDFIKYRQEKDGSWFGRWGVNHIYGTAAVLPGSGRHWRGPVGKICLPGWRLDCGSPERGRRVGRNTRLLCG